MALLSWPFGSVEDATVALFWSSDIWGEWLVSLGHPKYNLCFSAPEFSYVFSISSLWSKYKGKLVSQLPSSYFSIIALLHTYIRSCSKIICFPLNILHAFAFKLFQLIFGEERGYWMKKIVLRPGISREGDISLNCRNRVSAHFCWYIRIYSSHMHKYFFLSIFCCL